MNIETFCKINDWPIDIEEAEQIEILIREDGKTLWINTPRGCLLRLCGIKGEIKIEDKREKRTPRKRRPTGIK